MSKRSKPSASSKASVYFSPLLTPASFAKLLAFPFPSIPAAPKLRNKTQGVYKVAATQQNFPVEGCYKCIEKCRDVVIDAVVNGGADVVLLQELFITPYFCQSQNLAYFPLAIPAPYPVSGKSTDPISPFFVFFQNLAKEYNVVLPISFYEAGNPNGAILFNSIIVIDSDGSILPTLYRKTHIPDGPGYSEKFYFSPGDTGPQVFHTRDGYNLGIGICWDQWFPELARSMCLLGADVLMYPTAIGSEPQDKTIDSSGHWRRVMVGHGGANCVPVVASNRVGTEVLVTDDKEGKKLSDLTFYGTSFVTDGKGLVIDEMDRSEEGFIVCEVDVMKNKAASLSWGLMRDRRPEMYGVVGTKAGVMPNL